MVTAFHQLSTENVETEVDILQKCIFIYHWNN